MLPENLPNCKCGAHKYSGGGGSFSTSLAQQIFVCESCNAEALVLSGYAVPTHVFFSRDFDRLWKSDTDYLFGPLLAAWRTYEKDREDRYVEAMREAGLLHVQVAERCGLDPKKTTFYDLPAEVQDEIERKRDEIRVKTWYSKDAPLPPKLPRSILAYREYGDESWELIDHDECEKLEVPKDPIRVSHDAWWNAIFSALEARYGVIARMEIKNKYFDDKNNLEPWYEFTIRNVDFVVGPRKRVDCIDAFGKALNRDAIVAIATKDNVTFIDRPGGFTIHAWGKEKTIEYISAIADTSR